jgi:chromosome segregation ATPase
MTHGITATRVAFAGILAAALALGGCGWKKEIEQLRADNQKLSQEKEQLAGQLTSAGVESEEMQTTLDEVATSLEELRAKELQIVRSSIEVVQEGKPRSTRRDELKSEIDAIKKAIKENLAKLARLEQEKKDALARAKASGQQVVELEGKVTSMERLIGEMKASLEEKTTMIAELETKVLGLTQVVEEQTATIAEKETVIESQTKTINTAHVAIAGQKELEAKGVIEKKGAFLGMRGSWVQTGRFDPEIFREIDVTAEQAFSIAAPLKKVQVLSTHPQGSYELIVADEQNTTLKIVDPAAFWSGEKFLVVKYKD